MLRMEVGEAMFLVEHADDDSEERRDDGHAPVYRDRSLVVGLTPG
jgi:hypothetical protein